MKSAESILRYLQQPVLVLDAKLRPEIANPAFFQLFDIPPADFEGDFIADLIDGERCKPSLRVVIESLLTNGTDDVVVEVEGLLQGGGRIYLSVNACLIHEGDLPEMILLELRNITKEKGLFAIWCG